MTNVEKYNNVFKTVLNVTSESLNEAFTFASIDAWDSVAHLDLISQLEDTFDVLFDAEDILHFGSYENGKNILRRYGVDI